ncbi:MAG: DUF4296 domain-containing protein [Bacteroidetes bacterium]|nr:DUF4296 domain-containing protein [Bacteroidota bacterium]
MKPFLFLVLICLTSCVDKKELPPVDEQLVRVMVDLHVAEGAASNLTSRMRDTLLPAYYQQVFEIHHMEEAVWEQKIKELEKDPDLLQQL